MFTTNDVLDLLQESNPERPLTDHFIRRAIRYRKIRRPRPVAGRYVGTPAEVEILAIDLGLRVPRKRQRPAPTARTRARSAHSRMRSCEPRESIAEGESHE